MNNNESIKQMLAEAEKQREGGRVDLAEQLEGLAFDWAVYYWDGELDDDGGVKRRGKSRGRVSHLLGKINPK